MNPTRSPSLSLADLMVTVSPKEVGTGEKVAAGKAMTGSLTLDDGHLVMRGAANE